MRTKFKLQLEHSTKVLTEHAVTVDRTTLLLTPPLNGDYWLLRVAVSEEQAVILFPKFSTYGIGFQHEEDWNTNLPSACPRVEIYQHIRHNKGDRSIPKARCLEAIRMLQDEIVRLTGQERYRPIREADGTERASYR